VTLPIPSDPARRLSPRAYWQVFVIGLGTLVVPLDSSVNVAFPAIVRAFVLSIPDIQWIVISYVLTQTSLLLIFGRIGDMLGYRRVFLLGCAWSFFAFVLCALATSYPLLLGARILQGIGAGLVLSCGPALVTGLVTERDRARVLGLYTMIFGIGAALGSLLAGILVARWDWAAVFWFRAPISALAFLLVLGLPVPLVTREPQRFDTTGAVLLAFSIATGLFALNRLQDATAQPWPFAGFALATILGFMGFTAEERRAKKPIIDLRYFKNLDFSLINAAHALVNLAGFSVNLLGPFFLARATSLSVPQTGLVLAASAIGIIVAAPLAGRLAGQIRPQRLALLGMAAAACGQGGIAIGAGWLPVPVIAAAMFLQGIGVGAFQVAYFDVVTATLPRADRGVAGALGMVTRTVGVVSGATLLMLAFHALRALGEAHGLSAEAAFLFGLRASFGCAAAIPVTLIVIVLIRGGDWRRQNA
jgi:MFS family permease